LFLEAKKNHGSQVTIPGFVVLTLRETKNQMIVQTSPTFQPFFQIYMESQGYQGLMIH